ncbi:preprotein translocase subunit SecG [bacterium]|nr:preprotein translocase subunit SecG [bacterium]
MLTFIWALQFITALLIILLVLMHSPKGDGIGGIGGASHLFSSQKSAEAGLNKITLFLTVIFVICTFLLGFGIVK